MKVQKRTRTAVGLTCAVPVLWLASFAEAQAPAGSDAESPAESRAAEFQAVDPSAKKEDVPGGALVVAAYGIILVLLVLYVARLGKLYGKNRSEIERLTRALERGRRD